MEKSPPNGIFSQPRFKEGRSGYEPSDTETEWQEIPRHERERLKNLTLGPEGTKTLLTQYHRTKSPMALHRRHTSRLELESSSSPARRRHHSKSPYKPFRPEPDGIPVISPILQRQTLSNNNGVVNRVSEKSSYKRSVTAPRLRGTRDHVFQIQRDQNSHVRKLSIGEINEMVAEAATTLSKDDNDITLESTESSLPGDIFFSRECNDVLNHNKPMVKKPNLTVETQFLSSRPNSTKVPPQRSTPYHPNIMGNGGNHHGNLNVNIRGTTSSSSSSTTVVSRSSAARSKRDSGSVKSDSSGKTSVVSIQKFIGNRKKNQADTWFACMRKGACSASNKSPERRTVVDETSIIEKAFVVQSLPQFWADKYQPASLDGFICHHQQAQLLKQLVCHDVCPHILLRGPSGSGKRALAMALLREIYGDACSNLSHDLRNFSVQERRPTKVSVPITSSSHHMELNVNMEPNAKYALIGLVKEISDEFAVTPEVSNMNFKSDYKVLVLYEVDKAPDSIQHMIKWIIDRYSDICKLIVCCEDDADILEPVKNRFKLIDVDAPPTHEIMDVLIQIAKQEEIDLSMNFAAKIATKSKQNLRKAIMALEACTAHNYPFTEEQPIPLGWEETLKEISAEILANPSYSQLFSIRGKLQKLLVDFVHPRLILRKLVEEFLKGIDGSLKRELFYWHAYYDKRLPPGTTALLKLEEFEAKFMSIYRKNSSSRQFV